jgi:hypothetical protein
MQTWRDRAQELQDQLPALLDSTDKKQISAIKAAVLAELLPVLADLVEIIQGQEDLSARNENLKKVIRRNQKARMAALSGAWDELDELLANGDNDG